MQWEAAKAQPFIEFRRAFILGVDHDSEDGQRSSGVQDTPHRVRHQKLTDALAADTIVARKSPDRRGRNAAVAGKLAGNLFRQIVEVQLEGTQTIEADHPQFGIHSHEHARDVASLVLARPSPEPVVKLGFPAKQS